MGCPAAVFVEWIDRYFYYAEDGWAFQGVVYRAVLPVLPIGKMPSEAGKGFRRHFYDALQALGFNAAASLARRVMVSQSLFLTASLGVSQEPPTHKTLGSAR